MEGASTHRKGLWTEEEDTTLMDYIRTHGKGKWNQVARLTGLKRCGKSCRLRWINYLSPTVKRGGFSEEEEDLIVRLHNLLGNRWSLIAGRVPGRTDNQVKNHWNTHLSKKLGVLKKAKFKVSASPTTFLKETCKLAGDTNSGEPSDGAPEPEATQETSKRTIELTPTCGFNNNSFWFSDDFNLYTPGLMEFLDGYNFLDFDL